MLRTHEAQLTASLSRLEAKIETVITQVAIDRSLTSAHIAECNVRNKIADDRERAIEERERYAAEEWRSFMTESRDDRRKLGDKIVQTQIRLASMIGGVAMIGFFVEHFRLFEHLFP